MYSSGRRSPQTSESEPFRPRAGRLAGLPPRRKAGQRPQLEQGLLWTQRPDPVGGRAAEGRQQEVAREAEVDGIREAPPIQVVEVGNVAPRGAIPVDDGVVE